MRKHKEQVKGFIIGVLLTTLLSSTVLVAANTVTRDVPITFRDVRLVINGELITPKDAAGNIVEPFIWNGTTYLPVRAVADAFNLSLYWDRYTSTIYLNDIPQEMPDIGKDTTSEPHVKVENDIYGRAIKIVWVNADGTTGNWCEIEYDMHGNATRFSFDENGLLISREERDATGWFIRKTTYNKDGSIDYWYEYVHEGNQLIRVNVFNSDDTIRHWIENEYIGYNESGQLVIRLTRYNADGVAEDVWYNMIQASNND